MVITTLVARQCPNDDPDCKKPTSEVMKTAIPAAIFGTIILVGLIVICFMIRRNKKKAKAEGAKARESLEIEIDDYPRIQKPGAAKGLEANYGVPTYGRAASANGIPGVHLRPQEDREGALASKPVLPTSLV